TRPGAGAPGRGGPAVTKNLDLYDVRGLDAALTLSQLELHQLALVKRAELVALDRGVVNENRILTFTLDEPIASRVTEPADGTTRHGRSSLPASRWIANGTPSTIFGRLRPRVKRHLHRLSTGRPSPARAQSPRGGMVRVTLEDGVHHVVRHGRLSERVEGAGELHAGGVEVGVELERLRERPHGLGRVAELELDAP